MVIDVILRLNTRLSCSDGLADETKHLIILPKQNVVRELIEATMKPFTNCAVDFAGPYLQCSTLLSC